MICKRYGGRPSDYLDLDEYQAFQFDAGVAYRYDAVDNDNTNERLTAVLNGITALMKAQGVKGAKTQKYDRVVKPTKPKAVDNVATAGISKMTVIERIEQ